MICERLIEVWLYFFLVGDVGIACFEFVDVKGAAVSVVEFQSSGRKPAVSSLRHRSVSTVGLTEGLAGCC